MAGRILAIALIIIMGLSITGVLPDAVYASDNNPSTLTNLNFANQLAEKLNIDIPGDLKGSAYFQALANALAAKGINNFVGLDPNSVVSYGEMIEVMYNVAGGKGATTIDQKLSFLINNGYNMFTSGNFNDPVSDNFVNIVFNSDIFNQLVAEAYSAPGGTGTEPGEDLIGDDAPGSTPENPSSGT